MIKLNPYLILDGVSAIVVVFPFWKGQVRTNRFYDDAYDFMCKTSLNDGGCNKEGRRQVVMVKENSDQTVNC